MYLDRRSFDSYVPEIWLHVIKRKRKMVHFMSLATVKVGSQQELVYYISEDRITGAAGRRHCHAAIHGRKDRGP